MANRCKNTITIIGLQEAPEIFVRELSKVMFQINLDTMDPAMWGEDPSIDGSSWYSKLVDEFQREGAYAARYGVLYPQKPYERLGVTAPRFYIETKWEPPVDEILKASLIFPELTFHHDWWVLQDGPGGEFVAKNGRVAEQIKRRGSWYLFDWHVLCPTVSLPPAHLPYTWRNGAHSASRTPSTSSRISAIFLMMTDLRIPLMRRSPSAAIKQKLKNFGLAWPLCTNPWLIKQLDFNGVFLEEEELTERYPAVVEADKALMQSLRVQPLLPASGEAVRFQSSPSRWRPIDKPCRALVQAVHYLNTDSTSGR